MDCTCPWTQRVLIHQIAHLLQLNPHGALGRRFVARALRNS